MTAGLVRGKGCWTTAALFRETTGTVPVAPRRTRRRQRPITVPVLVARCAHTHRTFQIRTVLYRVEYLIILLDHLA